MTKNKFRIVHVEDYFHPEMGYQLNFTAKYKGDIDMHIISSSSLKLWSQDSLLTEETIAKKDREFEQKYGIHIHRLPTMYAKKNGYNLLMKGLVKKIYELKPDVLFVHAMESFTAFSLLMKAKLYRDFLVCSDTHTLYNQRQDNFVEKIYFPLFKLFAIRKLKKYNSPVFYTATENKEILIKDYGLKSDKVFPYLIGTDDKIFFPDKKTGENLRNDLGIDKKKKIILYAGKFNLPKSPHLIMEALKRVEDLMPDTVLVMLGGKNKDYYDKYFSTLVSIKNVQILILDAVNTSELNAYYNMADLVVFPKENTLSALDCQLSGTPVVMEDDQTNRERLQKGGQTYKPNDLSHLGSVIVELLQNEALCNKLSHEGQKFISSNYSYQLIIQDVENTIAQHIKLYHS